MNTRTLARKPGRLSVVVLVVSAGLLFATGVLAEPELFSKESFKQLVDGDLKLTPVGHRGVLHMTFKSPSQEEHALYVSHADNGIANTEGVHLSVRLPW